MCHFFVFPVSGSGVPLPGLRALEPRAGTDSALSRFLLKLPIDIQSVARNGCDHLSHEERRLYPRDQKKIW